MAVRLKHPRTSWEVFAVLSILTLEVGHLSAQQPGVAKPEMMSVVINSDSVHNQDMIQVLDSPDIMGNRVVLTVEYRCSQSRRAGVEITVPTQREQARIIFRKGWKCSGGYESPVKRRLIRLKLPAKYVYTPDRFNPDVFTPSGATIRAWLLETFRWNFAKKNAKDAYSLAFVKATYNTSFLPPFSRPVNHELCLTWSGALLQYLESNQIPVCPVEKEIVEVVGYPAAFAGSNHGIYRRFQKYSNPQLESHRKFQQPTFTVSMWVYVLEYCRSASLCSLMHHFNKDDFFLTPLLCFNPQGKLHVQVMLESGSSLAVLTPFPVPKHQWIHLVFAFRKNRWTLDIEYGENFNRTLSTFLNMNEEVTYNDTDELFTFGGSELMPSFKGYIGQVTYYRNKAFYASELPRQSPYHPMFGLGITVREDRCQAYVSKTQHTIYQAEALRQYLDSHGTCHGVFERWHWGELPLVSADQCPVWETPPPKLGGLVGQLVRRRVLKHLPITYQDIGDAIYRRAVAKIDKSVSKVPRIVRLLKQAACYQNYDAMYMLSVILNNGFLIRANEIQSHAFLMLASLQGHRLSMMSLANKHNLGLDGIPLDKQQAYMYYKYVADKAREDRDKHKDTDIVTEAVRLTDEVEMREQTDENGDVFMWMKHQAQQGVLGAQQYVARSLFWGSRGLQRNVHAALEYFRLGAEQQDPVSMYDYGIVLMRGQGVKKNVTKGLELMEQSANKGNPNALSALGWHALEIERNFTKAAMLLERAHKMGNPDAGFNLGHMYLTGKYPNTTIDRHKAYELIQWAAIRHQFDAGIMLSQFFMKGTVKLEPDLPKAVEWARFMAEKNPHLGHVLRKAFKSYRDGNVEVAMFYYMMAADSGMEVANFNLALICEENKDGLATHVEKECQWHRFNISVQREEHHIDSYSLIKMGDLHWYGCEGLRDERKAVDFYIRAARKNDPHAVFNLAFLVEEGVNLPAKALRQIGINPLAAQDNVTLLTELYTRCKESPRTEAYLPCSLALWRVQLMDIWGRHKVWMGLSSAIGVAVVTTATLYSIYNFFMGLRFSGEATRDTV